MWGCVPHVDVTHLFLCFRHSDNQRAQDALNLTLFHWGLHGWAAYNFVGLATAFVSHRMGTYLGCGSLGMGVYLGYTSCGYGYIS